MAEATLTINSRNYGAWSLRGWLLCKLAGLDFDVEVRGNDDPSTRAELLLMSPSFLVPCLYMNGMEVWDTLAIGEYLNEERPDAGLLPADRAERARCRAISGEMHSGFASLRSALPMNVTARYPGFTVFSGARADLARISEIWARCLDASGGPFLFGASPTLADAMYAPVCTRLATYEVDVDTTSAAYRDHLLGLPELREWAAAAEEEPEGIVELDAEF